MQKIKWTIKSNGKAMYARTNGKDDKIIDLDDGNGGASYMSRDAWEATLQKMLDGGLEIIVETIQPYKY